jgi:hypothetical protein
MKHYTSLIPPYLSYSSFLPYSLAIHLMQKKKDRTGGVKFEKGGGDGITNMEGALHTFLTPIVPIFIHGDYHHDSQHHIIPLPNYNGKQCARVVLLSALVQPDFQDTDVMVQLTRLGQHPFIGGSLQNNFTPISINDKQNAEDRQTYDIALKQHIVWSLTFLRVLPALSEVAPISVPDAIALLERMIRAGTVWRAACAFTRIGTGEVLSLELLLRTAFEQARNEFRALERLCARGYVYTFDPPSIFARRVSATFLNRLTFAALSALAAEVPFRRMCVYAFNDYADPDALPLLRCALSSQPTVRVMAKAALFGADGAYVAPRDCGNTLLVVHSNGSAFAQSIETERAGGSLEGTIGAYSSAAASLHRQHPHLLTGRI